MFIEKAEIHSKWIWTKNNIKKNTWVCFRKKFGINTLPSEIVIAKISAETKYYLYINGALAVFEGSLNRGPFEKGGYIDFVDVTKYLKSGLNTIAIIAWFWGNEGRNNIDSGKAGFIFECQVSNKLLIQSDESWKVINHPSYYDTGEPLPSYLYGGYNIGFNAQNDFGNFTKEDYDDNTWENATVFGMVPCEPWHELYKRPVPLIKFSNLKNYKSQSKQGNKIIANLPFASHITPYFKIKAKSGEIVDIRTDHYTVNGGPGDEMNCYNGHRVEYITKDGIQEFEALNWLMVKK
jgi:alpha-L-rhamnosidase